MRWPFHAVKSTPMRACCWPTALGLPKSPRFAGKPQPETNVRMFSDDAWHDAPLYRVERLAAGNIIRGPAIITDANATTVVEPQWQAEVTAQGHLLLTRSVLRTARAAIGTTV